MPTSLRSNSVARCFSLLAMPAMLVCGLTWTRSSLAEVRIKDITDIEGVRINQLTGMGLVTGLNGTGSKSPVTRQYAINFMQRMGMRVDPVIRIMLQTDTTQKTNNLSVVTVTANLPAFARRGMKMDVLVSAFDDSTSLEGGQLILTPLSAVDGQTYAVAAGPVSTGGFSFAGQAASVQKNFPTTGRVSDGATIEEETDTPIGLNGTFKLVLKQADFETARRVALAINGEEPGTASVVDATAICVIVPPKYRTNVAEFAGMVGSLHVIPDGIARVVINERTGTVVIGENVKISKVLITHANLSITTTEAPQVSQPNAFSEGETVVVPRTNVSVDEQQKQLTVVDETVTLGDLAQALNSLGVAPRDLSSILQQLKEAGALHADLELK